MPDSGLTKCINGKSLNVNIVNPPIENPWRTQGDYIQEQEEARERHAMFQEQHKILQKSHQVTVVAVVFSCIVALATCTLVYFSYQQTHILQEKSMLSQQESLKPLPTTLLPPSN